MNCFKMSAIALLGALMPLTVSAQENSSPKTVTLSGFVYDFTKAHPDFNIEPGDARGVISKTLPDDGIPTLTSTDSKLFSTQENFAQWFKPINGVNVRIPTEITLTQNKDGVFEFDRPTFFPVDSEG